MLLQHFKKYNIDNIPITNNIYVDAMENVALVTLNEIEDEEIILTINKIGMPYYMDYNSLDHFYESYFITTHEHTSTKWYKDIYQ